MRFPPPDDAGRVAAFRARCASVLPYGIAADDATLAQLLQEIGGSERAQEIASLLVRVRRPDELVDELRNAVLRTEARQGGLADLFVEGDRRFDAATDSERRAWTPLGVFSGLFDRAQAVAVLSGAGVDDGERMLGALIGADVVVRTSHNDRLLFRIPAVYRAPALRALADEPDTESRASEALFDFWLHRVGEDHQVWWAPNQAQRLAELETHSDDLTMLIESTRRRRPGATLDLVTRLLPFWLTTARNALATRYLFAALDDPRVDSRRRDAALYALGWTTAGMPDAVRVGPLLAARAEDGDAALTQIRGFTMLYEGRIDLGVRLLRAALAGHESQGDTAQTLLDLSLLASACSLAGDQRAAFDSCERAVALCEQYGADLQRNYALWTFALSAWRDGDHHRGYVLALDGALTAARLGDEYIGAICLEVVAFYEATRGDAAHAARLFGVADGIRARVGITILIWNTVALHDRYMREAEERLGPGRFWREFRAGRGVGLLEATEWLQAAPAEDASQPALTARQREIAALIAKGRSNKEIARLLLITVSTVENHIQNIFGKLGVSSRTQVAVWSTASGSRG